MPEELIILFALIILSFVYYFSLKRTWSHRGFILLWIMASFFAISVAASNTGNVKAVVLFCSGFFLVMHYSTKYIVGAVARSRYGMALNTVVKNFDGKIDDLASNSNINNLKQNFLNLYVKNEWLVKHKKDISNIFDRIAYNDETVTLKELDNAIVSILLHVSQSEVAQEHSTQDNDPLLIIEKLLELHKLGIITDAEFSAKKEILLAKITK